MQEREPIIRRHGGSARRGPGLRSPCTVGQLVDEAAEAFEATTIGFHGHYTGQPSQKLEDFVRAKFYSTHSD